MLKERCISSQWVQNTLSLPDYVENNPDGTTHYIKKIEEYERRWLRVIVNEKKVPPVIVTVFFDRRLRRKYNENKD